MSSPEFRNHPVYQKALEIFKVSRAIACSISDNRNLLEIENSADINHKVAGEIVTDSLSLVPKLALYQNTSNPLLRMKRAKKIQKAARNILLKCKRMEYNGIKEKEFLSLLTSEIQQFNRLFAEWTYNLQLKNRTN